MEEIWKDIKGYEGTYQVSNLGSILSTGAPRKDITGKIAYRKKRLLKLHKAKSGYLMVTLSKNSKVSCFLVHRLVASAFIKINEGESQVNHINGDKLCNIVSNLEWCTGLENTRHAIKLGLSKKSGEANHNCKITKEIALEIKIRVNKGEDTLLLSKEFNLTRNYITAIARGVRWKHLSVA